MIVQYKPEWKEDFERLNRAWIEKYFSVEPADLALFQDPEKYIVQNKGQIFFVLTDGVPVATVGVMPAGEGTMELVKMAVDEAHQGKGHARALCQHALEYARRSGTKKIVLYTNSQLLPAIRLYSSLGFTHADPEEGLYQRADVKMEIHYGEVPSESK